MVRRGILAVVALVLAGTVGYSLYLVHGNHRKKPPATIIQPHLSVKPPAAPAKLTASYLVSGDTFWGRGIDYFAQRSPLGINWPFSSLNEFHPEKYNGWITDMECPVNDLTVPYQTQVDKLILQCPAKYLPAAAKYFTAMTIANNHTDNTGREGFLQTQKNLVAAGIQPFGDYDLSQTGDLCEVVSMPALAGGKPVKLPIAMCGYHWLARSPTAEEIAKITEYSKYFPVWVFPHGGTEYDINFTPQQQAMYQKFIDAGASVVFGDHPHVVEPTEAYKGKLIIYDLSNLIYDSWFDNEVTKTLIMNVNVSANVDTNLQKYLDMGQACAAFKDSCLQTAENENLTAYKMTYSYKVIGGDRSNATMADRLVQPDNAATYQWLLSRLDWAKTSASLTTTAF